MGEHVIGAYTFIMDNYEEGDAICLFGFSRGAYTARALAGMLYSVGIPWFSFTVNSLDPHSLLYRLDSCLVL